MKRFSLQFLAIAATLLMVSAIYVEETLQDICTATSYANVAAAVESCTNIVINGITVPAGITLELDLKSGASLKFEGTTKFEYSAWKGPLVRVKGSNVTVKGASGSVLDGEGAKYWDGKGGSGSTKPKFFRIQTTGGSYFSDITLKNCPMNCVSIGASDTTLSNWTVDVSDGDAQGGHNTDGFDIAGSTNLLIEDSVVKNQDDCVAINEGSGLIFNKLYCSGGHGLSLSVGLSKESGVPNTVSNVTFNNSVVENSKNGMHIKTHPDGGTGSISSVTYSNIVLSGIENFGIQIQENYPSGAEPKANVPINYLTLNNVTGSMSGAKKSMGVYILCADNGCSNWSWSGLSITNTTMSNYCNFTPSGFKC